jgi:ribokinase
LEAPLWIILLLDIVGDTMANPPRICVVGSANVDLTFRTPRLPRPGETLAGHAFHLGMGGTGANQAVAAARLGAAVTFVARVGNDPFGQEAISRYRAEGMDTSFVRQDAHCPTGTAAIMVDDTAENCIIVVAGADANLSLEDVSAAAQAIQSADVVLCQLETPLAVTLEAFRLARAAGVRTVLTPLLLQCCPTSYSAFVTCVCPIQPKWNCWLGERLTAMMRLMPPPACSENAVSAPSS